MIIGILEASKNGLEKIQTSIKPFLGKAQVSILTDNTFDLLSRINKAKFPPHLLLLNLSAHSFDAIALANYLSFMYPQIRVLFLSETVSAPVLRDTLECGGWGALNYNELNELPLALDAIARGELYISPNGKYNLSAREAYFDYRTVYELQRKQHDITSREFTFLLLNVIGLDYSEIAELMFIQRKTIENLVARLSRKLNVKSRHSLILYSIRHGLARTIREHHSLRQMHFQVRWQD